jgi:hypothetical protein
MITGRAGVATTTTVRQPMTLIGAAIRMAAVGGPTQLAASTGSGGLTAPLITAGVALLGVIIGPLVQDWVRSRRNRVLSRKDAEIRKLRRENDRLKRDGRDR